MRKLAIFCAFAWLLGAVTPGWSSTETVLHAFRGARFDDGADPVADLVYDPVTNLVYGVTNTGGTGTACAAHCGTVFAVNHDGTFYSVVSNFQGGIDGANPQAGLVADAAGNLYGTTYNGGTHNLGTVFKLTYSGGQFQESVLLSFSGKTATHVSGAHPLSRLVLDANGNLYGTTYAGGASNHGEVFELTVSGTEQVLLSFTGANGENPKAGVVFGSGGVLWGTTYRGGGPNLGTVFQLGQSGGIWQLNFSFPFAGPNGANPAGAVVLDAFGNVFGTTQFGGPAGCAIAAAGCGVVFELQPNGNGYTETAIYNFSGGPMDGAAPLDDLTLAADGTGTDLYGTASEGGTLGGNCSTVGCGTAFVLCSQTSSCSGSANWTIYPLVDFTGLHGLDPGRKPAAGLLIPPPGFDSTPHGKGGCTSACLGTVSQGAANGNGAVVSLTGPGN